MEKGMDERTQECDTFDRRSWQTDLWTEFYASELNDPKQRELYSDLVEVRVETYFSGGHAEILGRDFFTWWQIELTFLQWLKRYLSRGIGFEEAWFLAVEALRKTEEGHGVTDEELEELGEEFQEEYDRFVEWYEDDDIYRPRVEAWTEQLVDFGMSQDKAEDMAEELISLLREISFEQMIRPTDFWVVVGRGGGERNQG